MKNNTNYTLALEARPNSYEPIFIFPSIEKIDNLTSHYNEFDFSRMLIKNYYIDQENDKCPFTIICQTVSIKFIWIIIFREIGIMMFC